MIFNDEQRNQLRSLTEKKRRKGRGDEGRSKQRYGQKAPSGAQLSRKFKIAGQALGDLEGALTLAGHTSQARDIERVAGMVHGVSRGIHESADMLTEIKFPALRPHHGEPDEPEWVVTHTTMRGTKSESFTSKKQAGDHARAVARIVERSRSMPGSVKIEAQRFVPYRGAKVRQGITQTVLAAEYSWSGTAWARTRGPVEISGLIG